MDPMEEAGGDEKVWEALEQAGLRPTVAAMEVRIVIVIVIIVLLGDLVGRIEDAGPLHARRQVSKACLSHSAEPLQYLEQRQTFSDGGNARLGQLWLKLHGGCKLPGLTQCPQAQGCLHAHSCDARGCWWSGSSHISRVGGSPGPTLEHALACDDHHAFAMS